MTRLLIPFWRCADMRWFVLFAVLAVAGCRGDETLFSYGAADKVWQLVELNEAPFTASATIEFPEPGKITGMAPCNSYSGGQAVPYPWFEATQIISTKRACPDLEAEVTYLNALRAATLSEVLGEILILSNPEGLSMVFTAGG